jgi:DHA1 family tetracycline resistance protein-like MFS transporter
VRRFGERRTVIIGTLIGAFSFLGYGLASQGWMIPGIIIFGAFAGVSGPAIQSLVTSRVDETEQGKIQGALTSLTSLTNIIAPILFNTLLFSYFISDEAPVQVPGAPFFVGFVLLLVSIVIAFRVFRKFPDTAKKTDLDSDTVPKAEPVKE